MSENDTKILVVGNGAREYALCKSLQESENVVLYGIGGKPNGGLEVICAEYHVHDVLDNHYIVSFCIDKRIDLVFVGPEAPLANGLVDELTSLDTLFCVGPSQTFAKIESSKSFARKLAYGNPFLKQHIPDFIHLEEYDKERIKAFYKKHNNQVVIKPDGLHGGKGVRVFEEDFSSFKYLDSYCLEMFASGETVVLEEKLVGNEFTFMSFVNDIYLKHSFPIMDFKRLYDGNIGPNTGGMGCLTENNGLSFLSTQDVNLVKLINEAVIEELYLNYSNSNVLCRYHGFLYGSFIKTLTGIKIIEFNCRLGDPEGIVLLEHLKTPLLCIVTSMQRNILKNLDIKFETKSTICKYVVPINYARGSVLFYDALDIRPLFEYPDLAILSGSFDGTKMLGSRAVAICCSHKTPFEEDFETILNDKIVKAIGTFYFRKDLLKCYLREKYALSYVNCGVDITKVTKALAESRDHIQSTHNQHVVSDIGSFGGMYALTQSKSMSNPVLVSSTDGVGTKSLFMTRYFHQDEAFYRLGQDLVHHCINDILVQGADPLFFLDYFASSHIFPDDFKKFIEGVSYACRRFDCVLIGGETAEMPGIYNMNAHDMVGTIVGIVDKSHIIDGKRNVVLGDVVLAIPSSGPHTNGYSLINKLYFKPTKRIDERIKKALGSVHRCYLPEISALRAEGIDIHALCHITGGGLIDNPPRVIPDTMEILYDGFQIPPLFEHLQQQAQLSERELWRIFNCGVGMMIICSETDWETVTRLIPDSFLVGEIVMKDLPQSNNINTLTTFMA